MADLEHLRQEAEALRRKMRVSLPIKVIASQGTRNKGFV